MTKEVVQLLQRQRWLSSEQRNRLAEVLRADVNIYAPYLARMAMLGVNIVESKQGDPNTVASALCVAAGLYEVSNGEYQRLCPRRLKGEALREHQARVLGGVVRLVPEFAGTSSQFGVEQMWRANSALEEVGPDVQSAIFELRSRLVQLPTSLRSTSAMLWRAEAGRRDSMTFEELTTEAISQIVAGVHDAAAVRIGEILSQRPYLRIVDLGAGYGNTIAAIADALLLERKQARRKCPLSIVGVESSLHTCRHLRGLAQNDRSLARLGLSRARRSGEGLSSTYSIVNGSFADAIADVNPADNYNQSTIVVVTGNNSWQWLMASQKRELIECLRRLDNVIVIIGDSSDNTSVQSKRYDNLAIDGPLRPGNAGLAAMFGNADFMCSDMCDGRVMPRGLKPVTAGRLRTNNDNDCHLWVACKGPLARHCLDFEVNL